MWTEIYTSCVEHVAFLWISSIVFNHFHTSDTGCSSTDHNDFSILDIKCKDLEVNLRLTWIFICLISRTLIIPARQMIAVPCWSSWKTGMFICFLHSSSTRKQSGPLISKINSYLREQARLFSTFKVHASKRGFEELDSSDKLFRICSVYFNVNCVHLRELFEKNGLALHDRLRGQSADVSQTENSGSIWNYSNEVSFVRVFIGFCRISDEVIKLPKVNNRVFLSNLRKIR